MLLDGKLLTPQVLGRIPSLGRAFERYPQVRLAYLFGSAATGRMTPLSDIDIAAHVSDDLERGAIHNLELTLIDEIADTLKTDDFDLVVLNSVPLTLKFQVIRTGRILHAKSEAERVEFETRVRDAYFDFAPLRDEYYRVFFQNIKEGRMLGDRRNQGSKAPQQPPKLPGPASRPFENRLR